MRRDSSLGAEEPDLLQTERVGGSGRGGRAQ